MKIEKIEIDNFLRIGRLRLPTDSPRIHLICGHNEAGKTSLQEAIRFCLLGETERVERKSDYKLMIRDGATSGQVRVKVDGVELARDVQTAKGTADDYPHLPFGLEHLLDATRYPWLDPKARRAFMFKLMQISINATAVKERLLEDYRIPAEMVDLLTPMLRAGFDAAHQLARDKATESRGAWKEITNETYGSKKAEDWKPEPAEDDPVQYAEAVARAQKAEEVLAEMNQELGRAQESGMALGQIFPCPSCGAKICIDNSHQKPVRVVTDEEIAMTPQQSLLDRDEQTAAATVARDAAARELAEARDELDRIKRRRLVAEEGDKLARRARIIHDQVECWVRASDALSPTGIPAQIVADKLKPINDRLRQTAVWTKWPQVSITPDMSILVDNRPYALQSESSQWRAQAAIAEAISAVTNTGILVLDRVDVLDVKNRVALIKWMLQIREDHQTILLFGTFKEPPKVPDAIAVHWMQDGAIVKATAEAA